MTAVTWGGDGSAPPLGSLVIFGIQEGTPGVSTGTEQGKKAPLKTTSEGNRTKHGIPSVGGGCNPCAVMFGKGWM